MANKKVPPDQHTRHDRADDGKRPLKDDAGRKIEGERRPGRSDPGTKSGPREHDPEPPKKGR